MKTETEFNIPFSSVGKTTSISFSNCIRLYEGNSLFVKQKKISKEYRDFINLKDKWKEETMFESNLNNIFSNSNYVDIIKFGANVLPWIIKDLRKDGGYWFVALTKITGLNPIRETSRGVYEEMKKDWLSWADNNYLNERSVTT
ncbi:MAG TPA: hypothetical protein PK067_06625 [Kaistella chaponensis]|jgi:hypothetical protein|nr:hypothetical protein [Kaistella chaponensis]